ncbi:ThrRS/AlaRS common domain-containing protein [Hygrophoropsis aurantiaca]|uniref:ThrRS/AlaRS common domain-containing protein n=1 Tax=Hygrophoropsis aurantiaca TaxID=72124 RepID=A0ACB8AS72_9AGAM|nr:ThrRS/AlaRS common domain-containing protein [Hygrophoropsis aurantiaca]
MAASAILLPPSPTPPSYHRIVSPTLTIPSDPLSSIPVGLLACQRDPLLRELDTTVVSCTISQSGPPPSSRTGKKAPVAAAPEHPTLEVILHDTVIFPEGGGQPSDIGILKTTDGRIWTVFQVKRLGGHAIHYVRVDNAETDSLQFVPGTKIHVALGDEGIERRLDHMSIHTSQHLLSAVLESQFNLPTLSWGMSAYPAPCYVELPRSMNIDEIQSVQAEANKYVFEGRQVYVEVQELSQAQLPGVEKLENGRSINKALPADYTGGIMRVVVIDGIDRSPCCGTQLPTLHNLQLFVLPHTEAMSRSSTTSARLYFLAGPRLITYLSNTHSQLTSAAALLSCGLPVVPDRLGQVLDDRKKAEKSVDDLKIELAKFVAKEILQDIQNAHEDPLFVKHIHRTDDLVNPLGFLSAVASAFSGLVSTKSSHVIILSSSPSSQTSSSTSVVLVFGLEEKRVKEAGEQLKSKLGVKGGGKGPRWSGKFVGVWKEGREDAAVADILEAIAGQ